MDAKPLSLVRKLCMSSSSIERYNKSNKITQRGELVKSEGERQIANYLNRQGISYIYEQRLYLPNGRWLLPDFTLPQWHYQCIIEYWGLTTPSYIKRMKQKKRLYKKQKFPLIDVFPKHLSSLDKYLAEELHRRRRGFIHL